MAAVGERAKAAAVPSRHALWRTTRRAWYAYTSAKTANALLVAMMIAGLVAAYDFHEFGCPVRLQP